MRGINKVVVSGSVTGEAVFTHTRGGVDVCNFIVCTERSSSRGTHKAYPKVNVYMDNLVELCRDRLFDGCYVIVEGELMNREGRSEELTEVRAREIIFLG